MNNRHRLTFTQRALMHSSFLGLGGAILLAFITVIITLYINDLLLPDHWYYLVDDDQARSALVAKSLAQGLGYKTPLLPNAMIEFYHQAGKLNVDGLWENSDRFPMTIVEIFLLFKLFGSTSPFISMAVFGGLFFIASAALLHRVSTFLTGKPLIGLLAVALMCITHDTTDTIYYKSADDIFYGLLILCAYTEWRDRIYAVSLWRPIVLGVFIGLAFLCRANIGVFFAAGIMVDALWGMYRHELRFTNVARAGFLTFLGVAICVLPWGIYSYHVWGVPFFSANSLYQFSFYSPYQMSTDSWWKLHSPVGKIANFTLFKNDPMPFLTNWFRFISYNFLGLPAAYFLEICAAGYSVVCRWQDATFVRIRPFMIVALVCFFLNLLSLGFYIDAGYSPTYLIYIIPVFFVLGADGLRYFLSSIQATVQKKVQKSHSEQSPSSWLLNQSWFMTCFGIILAIALTRKIIPFAKLFSMRGSHFLAILGAKIVPMFSFIFVLFILSVFILSVFILSAIRSKRTLHPALLLAVICLAVCTLLTPNVGLRQDAYISLPKNNPDMATLQQITDPNGIVLSFNGFYGIPWLTDRKTLGLPEYPDYIYEMITKYNLPIESIYLDGAMSWFLFSGSSHWAPSYEIYPILGRIAGIIPGFELVNYRYETESYSRFNLPEIPKEIAVYRRIPGFDFAKLSEAPTQYVAENPADRIHFVSGFGEVGSIGGVPVIFASDDVRKRFVDRSERLRPWADSDITFHATSNRKPKAVVIDAYMLGETQLYFYLNLDLDIYDRSEERAAKQVGDVFVGNSGWRKIRIVLPKEAVKDGFNKLGFHTTLFHTVSVCNSIVDAPTRVLVDVMDPETCFKLNGNALPSGVLTQDQSPSQNRTFPHADFDALQRPLTEAMGTMLIRKIDFEY